MSVGPRLTAGASSVDFRRSASPMRQLRYNSVRSNGPRASIEDFFRHHTSSHCIRSSSNSTALPISNKEDMNSNLLELFCLPSAPSPDEPTTSSSSEDTESPSDETPTSEPMDYLSQLLINNPKVPSKRKARSLMETIDLLKKQKQAQEDVEVVDPPLLAPRSLPIPIFSVEGHHTAAAERLATMVSQEREREVKNQIKQMTNQITAEIIPTSADDDKRFACQICNKKFANKFLLNKHIFIHTGLRPHQCPDCHKSFNRKDNLLRHRKTHIQPMKEPERPTSLGISPLLLQAAASQSEVMNASSPESLLLSLFAAHQQQQHQQQV